MSAAGHGAREEGKDGSAGRVVGEGEDEVEDAGIVCGREDERRW